MQFDKNKNISLLLAPIPIKSFSEGTKVLHPIIDPSITEVDGYDAWKSFAHHCEKGSYNIKGIDFDQSYSPETHAG